jgi:hypothetical protein
VKVGRYRTRVTLDVDADLASLIALIAGPGDVLAVNIEIEGTTACQDRQDVGLVETLLDRRAGSSTWLWGYGYTRRSRSRQLS